MWKWNLTGLFSWIKRFLHGSFLFLQNCYILQIQNVPTAFPHARIPSASETAASLRMRLARNPAARARINASGFPNDARRAARTELSGQDNSPNWLQL